MYICYISVSRTAQNEVRLINVEEVEALHHKSDIISGNAAQTIPHRFVCIDRLESSFTQFKTINLIQSIHLASFISQIIVS